MAFLIDLGRYIGGVLTLALAALFSAVSLVPAYWLFTVVDERLGRFWAVCTTPFGYVLWGTSLCLCIVLYKRLTFYKLREGSFHIFTWSIVQWGITGYLVLFANEVFLKFLKGSPYLNWFYRGLGAKIGRRVNFQTTFVSDWDLLDIDDDTTFGGESAVIAHVLEANQIRLMPVRIGKSVTIGRGSVVFPGVTIGDRAIVGAMSLVPKGKTLPGNAVYAGTPVEKLRDRQAKDEPVSDPLKMSAKELLLSSGHHASAHKEEASAPAKAREREPA